MVVVKSALPVRSISSTRRHGTNSSSSPRPTRLSASRANSTSIPSPSGWFGGLMKGAYTVFTMVKVAAGSLLDA